MQEMNPPTQIEHLEDALYYTSWPCIRRKYYPIIMPLHAEILGLIKYWFSRTRKDHEALYRALKIIHGQ